MAEETTIAPPSFPLVAQINQMITDAVFSAWARENLEPLGLEVHVTGRLREDAHNAAVGGAENSAHLHGLAIDFQIFRNGQPISKNEAHALFLSVVKPTWQGFSLDELDLKNHIHVNLTRAITPSMTIATCSALAIGGTWVFKLLFGSHKTR